MLACARRLFGDKYKLQRKLGEGGFGAVYEAEEKKLSRKVAVKTLHAHISKYSVSTTTMRETTSQQPVSNSRIS